MLPNQTTKRYGSAPSVQVFTQNNHGKKDRRKIMGCCSVPVLIIFSIFTVFMVGIYVCLIFILDVDPRSPVTSIGNGRNKHKLPTVNIKRKVIKPDFGEMPDWSKEQWTPISLTNIHIQSDGKVDATITLCQLDFSTYSQAPHQYPMFRDLVSMSKCNMGKIFVMISSSFC